MTNNTSDQYRGIYGIPATPFNEDETLDVRSLESVLDFSVENGCHGIVMPVMASEYQTLTDTERRHIFDLTTKVIAKIRRRCRIRLRDRYASVQHFTTICG
jgi:dihydrodipicolinate synthase/N-acetylneuraminate lyase